MRTPSPTSRCPRFPRGLFLLVALTMVAAGCADSITVEDAMADARNTPVVRNDSGETVEAIGCSEAEVGEESGQLVGGFAVVEGELGPRCFGTADDRLLESWESLESFTTAQDRRSLAVFAGYENNIDGTLAFAGPLTRFPGRFIIAVDLERAQADPDELYLTMAHEFAHVLTQDPDQIDVRAGRRDCETFHNGFGCFAEDALMVAWIDMFWSERELAALPANGGVDEDLGTERCELDPSIIGTYAGSHPEEDFAETFSAWVFGVELASEVAPRLEFFENRGLDHFRERAMANGIQAVDHEFARCG